MKTADEVKPGYAPVYAAAMYPELAKIFLKHGYALAVHGSLRRDMDLIAVPWVVKASSVETVIKAVTDEFSVTCDMKPELRCHGRLAYCLHLTFGGYIDLSFFPN